MQTIFSSIERPGIPMPIETRPNSNVNSELRRAWIGSNEDDAPVLFWGWAKTDSDGENWLYLEDNEMRCFAHFFGKEIGTINIRWDAHHGPVWEGCYLDREDMPTTPSGDQLWLIQMDTFSDMTTAVLSPDLETWPNQFNNLIIEGITERMFHEMFYGMSDDEIYALTAAEVEEIRIDKMIEACSDNGIDAETFEELGMEKLIDETWNSGWSQQSMMHQLELPTNPSQTRATGTAY